MALCVLMLAAMSARAADGVWDNEAADNNWRSTANWNPNGLPGSTTAGSFASTETATFSLTGSGSINLGDNINIKSILFGVGSGDAAAFTVGDSNDVLNLSNNGTIAVNSGVTANEAIGVAGTSINISSTSNALYSFVNNGTGTLTLAGAVTANAGTSSVTTLTLDGSGNGVINQALSNAGANGNAGVKITKTGTGTWTLKGASLISGATTVSAGTLQLSSFTGGLQNSTVTVGSGATLGIDSASGTYAASVTRTSAVTLSNGKISDAGSSAGNTTDVMGVLTLSGNTFDTVTVTPDSTTVATLSFSSLTRGGGAIGLFNGVNLGVDSAATSNLGRVVFSGAAPAFVGSSTDGGTATGTTKNLGVIPYLVGEFSGSGGTATGTPNTFLTYNSSTGLRPLDIVNEYTTNALTAGNNIRITSNTTTAGATVNSVVMNGGTLSLSSAMTVSSGGLLFSGNSTISGTKVTMPAVEGVIIVNAGGVAASISAPIETALGGGSAKAYTLWVGSGSTLTLGGGISETGGTGSAGSLNVNGGGALVLGGSSSYTAQFGGFGYNFNINGGSVVQYTGSGGFGNTTIFNVNSGTVLDLAGGSVGGPGLTGGGTVKITTGSISVGSGTGYTFSGTMAGAGAFVVGGSNVAQTLSGSNNFAGGLVIQSTSPSSSNNNSILKISGGNALSDTGKVTITSNDSGRTSTLDLNASSETIGSLFSTFTLKALTANAAIDNTNNSSRVLTINTAIAGDALYNGTIKNTANATGIALVKKGINTQTLGSASTYGGSTAIQNGTLALDFSQFATSQTNTPSNYLASTSTLTLGGGNFTVIGRGNGATTSGGAWTGLTTSNIITFATLPSGLTVGQAVTGTGLSGYIAAINTAAKTVTLSAAPTATSGSDFATTGINVTTTQTLGNVSLTAGTGSKLVVNANGGAGTTLTLGNTWTRGANATLNLDISSGSATLTSNPSAQLSNGSIIGYMTVSDGTGTGLATISGGNIVRNTTTSPLAADTNDATANVATSGALAMNGTGQAVNSLTIDASTAGSLDLGGGTLAVSSGGVITTGGNNYIISNGQLGANNAELILHQYGSGVLTLAGQVSGGTGSLTIVGTGNVVLAGTNGYSGATVLTGAVTTFSSLSNLGSGSAITFGGGTLQYAAGNTADITTRTVSFVGAGGIIDTNGNDVTFASAIAAGNGGLTKAGHGSLTISALGGYTGDTTLRGGTLVADLGTVTTGVINSGSAILAEGGSLTIKGKSSGASSQTLGGLAVRSGDSVITINSNGGSGTTLTVNNTWNRTGGGTANFDLSSANAVLQSQNVSNTNGIIGSGWLTITDGTTTGFATYVDSAAVATNPIQRYTGATAYASGGTATTASTNYSVATNITLTAARSMNTLAVDTASGSLSMGGAFALNTTAILMTGANDYAFNNTSVGTSGSELIVQQYGSGKVTIAGAVSGGAGSLTKSGTGTLELTGGSSYAGATYVNRGLLKVSGGGTINNTSGVAINGGTLDYSASTALTQAITFGTAGGMLEGSGSVANVTGVRDATITGGDGTAGTLGISGNLLLGGGHIAATIAKATAGSPPVASDYNHLDVTGGSSVVDVSNADLVLTVGGGLEIGDTFFILTNASSAGITGSFTTVNGLTPTVHGDASSLAQNGYFNVGQLEFQISYNGDIGTSAFSSGGGNDVALQLTAVPEPGSLSLLGLGAAALLARRRRRHD